METKIKILLDNTPNYKEYIRSNSYWYKILNRNPNMIDKFSNEVKEKYKLRTVDKIENISNKLDMINKLIDVMR